MTDSFFQTMFKYRRKGSCWFLLYYFYNDARFNKLRKTFPNVHYRNPPFISRYWCNLKYFLRRGISYSEFYVGVIYKLRKIIGHVHFENPYYKRFKSFLIKDYDPAILQRTSCLVIDLSSIDSHGFLFGCAMTDKVKYYMMVYLQSLSRERYVGSSYPPLFVIP